MRAELERLVEAWNAAWLEKDAATVEKMMASAYTYVAPNGQVFDRAAILGVIRSPGYRLSEGTRTELWVKPLTDDAVAVVHRWRGRGWFEGETFEDDHRCTMVWVRHAGGWRIALEHCSPNED